MTDEPQPDGDWAELDEFADFVELASFQRGEGFRFYKLRPVDQGAELWRITEPPGARPESVEESTFRSSDEALEFLEELERTLRVGGWTATQRFNVFRDPRELRVDA